ncbi:MAG: hypothetical protein ACKV19_04665 [Verrucomicrobiales bacterium]
MKPIPFILLVGSCLLGVGRGLAQTGDAAPTEVDKATATVPYAEMKRLLQAEAVREALRVEGRGKPPPVAGGLIASMFRLDCAGGKAAVEAEFRVENFSGEWEGIPLMGAGLAVAGIEPPNARVLARDGQLCLITKEPGPVTVTLRFVQRDIAVASTGPVLELESLPSAVSTLQITGVPEDRAATVRGGKDAFPGDAQGIFALPANGGRVGVWLEDSAKVAAEMVPPTPSEWSLQNEIAVRRDDGSLRYTVRCHLSAADGSGLTATLALPAGARQTKAEGEDLATWRTERAEGGAQQVALEWKGRGVLEREVIFSYTMPQPPLDSEWKLAAPAVANPDRTRSLFVIAVPPLWSVSGQGLRHLSQGSGLSRWLGEALAGSPLAVIEATTNATVMVNPLPQVTTADGTVQRAQYHTRIVADGSSITEAKIELEHEGASRFAIDLPADGSLLICSINGQTSKPIAGEGRRLEFPLPPGEGKAAKTEIALSFTAAKGKLDDVSGQVGADLPLTPWFIHAVEWTLTLPDTYRISAVDGNVEYGGAAKAEHEVVLTKRLCRGEAPTASLFYEKKGL